MSNSRTISTIPSDLANNIGKILSVNNASKIVWKDDTGSANTVQLQIALNQTNANVTSANVYLQANDALTLYTAKAYTDNANNFLKANDALTLATAKSYTDNANNFLRANDALTLATAKSYTDTANSYLQNLIIGDGFATVTQLNQANTFLQANDSLTLSSAKSYTDAANTFLSANDSLTLSSAKSYTDSQLTANVLLINSVDNAQNNRLSLLESNTTNLQTNLIAANTFLQANDALTLSSAKSYTDAANSALKNYSDNKFLPFTGGTLTGPLVISTGGSQALTTSGPVSITGDLSVQGNINLSGNSTTYNSNVAVIQDPMIYLASNNADDVVDIGFYGHFIGVGSSNTSHYQHTGLVRDYTDRKWKLFSNVAEPQVSNSWVDFNNAIYDTLKLGNIEASSANINGNDLITYIDTTNAVQNNRLILLESNTANLFVGLDGANTFLQANDGLTLSYAKIYSDTSNSYLQTILATKDNWAVNNLLFANYTGSISNSGINYYTSNSTLLFPNTTTINSVTGNVVFSDASFLIQNNTDPTKFARFVASGGSTGTTVQYNLPLGTQNVSSLLDSQSSQTITGAKTFSGGGLTISSGGFTCSTTTTISGSGTSIYIGTSQTTTGTIIGGPSQTSTITFGQSTATQTVAIGTGATSSGNTKTINIGTAGVSGSVTNINLGSAVAGSKGTITHNSANTILTGNVAIGTGSVSTTDRLVIQTVGQGASGVILQSSTTGWLRFIANTSSGSYNNLVQPGDQSLIFSSGTQNTASLTIAPWSATQGGIRIDGQGNTSIGSPTTTYKFNVAGSANTGELTATSANITSSITSTSNTTGALTVVGGLGVSSNAYIDSVYTTNLSANGTINFYNPLNATNQVLYNTTQTTGYAEFAVTDGTRYAELILNKSASSSYGNANEATIRGSGGTTGLVLSSSSTTTPNTRFITGASGSSSEQFRVVNTANAVNYLQVTGGSTGNGATLSVTGSDTAVDINILSKTTGNTYIKSGNGTQFKINDTYGGGGAAANYFSVYGRQAGADPIFAVEGSDTNINSIFAAKAGAFVFRTTGITSGTQLQISHTASAVNYVQVTGSTTTNTPALSSQGSDTNIALQLSSKGNGALSFSGGAGRAFRIDTTSASANFLGVFGTATGNNPVLSAAIQSTDTNLGINYVTKGTGSHVFQTGTSSNTQFQVADTANSTTYIVVSGGVGGSTRPYIGTAGTPASGLSIFNQVGNAIRFQTNGFNNAEQFVIDHTSTAVNYISVTGSATGITNYPTISAQGSDTNINLALAPKGTGGVSIWSGGGPGTGTRRFIVNSDGSNDLGVSSSSGLGFKVLATTNQVNYISTTGSISGAGAVAFTANGTDTNINLALTPKGTGTVNVTSDLVVAGNTYANKQISINHTPTVGVNSAIEIIAANTKGGAGYADFLKVTNTSGGASNPNKFFRLNSIGSIEIIDSSYQNNLVTISDNGDVTIKGNTTINGIAPEYAPNRPGFRVIGANTSNINATTTLSQSNWAVDWIQGNYLNQSTGIFTAPVAGLYSVNLTARTQTNNYAGLSSICVQKTSGGTTTNVCYIEWYNNTTANHMGSSTIVKLAVGDTLKTVVTAGQVTFDLNDNWAVVYIG